VEIGGWWSLFGKLNVQGVGGVVNFIGWFEPCGGKGVWLPLEKPGPVKSCDFFLETSSWFLLGGILPFGIYLDPESSTNCVFCDAWVESSTHFFLHCSVISKIWRKIMDWLRFNFLIPHNLFVHLECWSGEARGKKMRKGFWLVWHVIIRVIWKARNARIFENHSKDVEKMVEEIKELSWRWVLTRLKVSPCLFYEWNWDLVIA